MAATVRKLIIYISRCCLTETKTATALTKVTNHSSFSSNTKNDWLSKLINNQ